MCCIRIQQVPNDLGDGVLIEQVFYTRWSPSGVLSAFFTRRANSSLGNANFGQQDWRYLITVSPFYYLNVTPHLIVSSNLYQPTGGVKLEKNCSVLSFVAIKSLSTGESNVYCYVHILRTISILIDSNQVEVHLHNKLRYV